MERRSLKGISRLMLLSGEQGKVDESMREMAAIEALKSEKSDKEVRTLGFPSSSSSNASILPPERTSTTNRHLGCLWTPKAARV